MNFRQWYRAVMNGDAILLDEAPINMADVPQGKVLVIVDERDQDIGIPEVVTSQERLNQLRRHVEPRQCNTPSYTHVSVSLGFPSRVVWSLIPSHR